MNEVKQDINVIFSNMSSSGSSIILLSLLLLTTVVINIQEASASGLFQFRFNSFDNPLSRDQDGICCSDSSLSYSSPFFLMCSSPCRIYLRICLNHHNENNQDIHHNIDIKSHCNAGKVTTQVLGEDQISSPGYIVSIPFNISSLDNLFYSIEVGHESSEGKSMNQSMFN